MTAWSWWQAKLAGQPVQMNDSNPQAGFYRQLHKAFYGARKTFTPVAYWPGEDGHLNCRIGDEDVTWQRGEEIWKNVGNNPVTHEAYHNKCEPVEADGSPNPNYTGLWPDEHPGVPMGDNRPPEPETFEDLRDEIEDLARRAKKRIDVGRPIMTQEEADETANLGDRLAELQKKAEELQKEELKPFTEGTKEVRAKWAPIISLADIYLNLKERLVKPWLAARKREAEQAATEAVAVGEKVEIKRPRAGTRGRAMSLKTLKRAEITDFDKCLTFFKESDAIKECVQSLANRAVRAGQKVPGTKVIEETSAV